ncbi:phosphatase domain-containing protein [Cognatishimia sp. MH4019]|uniref:phosphatase domain-containing protein n=1 Tax=Cognatishimia sp. MH4019 TaxID=2854030 RepID=UPI001CD56422|nr:phosphatase domain-containing protein [Cognatishimia sp. MH4019]
MSVKLFLARILEPIERRIDAVKNVSDAPCRIEPYAGYETPEGVVLRGRILTAAPKRRDHDESNKWQSAREFFRRFATDERADVSVSIASGDVTVESDEEGYFKLVVPRDAIAEDGTVELTAKTTSAHAKVFLVPDNDETGVISDIDDTMMHTGAYSLVINLWNTITGSVASRQVFPGSIDLIKHFHSRGAPIFYVSSSPWNLHTFLHRVFERNGLPLGPMFLRDLGISQTQFVTGTHGDHKGAAVQTILAAQPDRKFVLVGDTGQHDAEIYGRIARDHPERISRILLRQPTDNLPEIAEDAVGWSRAIGIDVQVVRDFSEVELDSGR